MKKKIGLICLALVLALGTLGVAFAMWSETLVIDTTVQTGEVDWEFATFTILDRYAPPSTVPDMHCNNGFSGPPYWWDDPEGKNVGWGSGELVDGPDGDSDMSQLNLTFHNVYPCYFNAVSVYPQNNGTVPIIFSKVTISCAEGTFNFTTWPFYVALDLSGDGKDDIEIQWGNAIGVQLDPGGGAAEVSFWFHCLQDAPQGETDLSLIITFEAVQWNEAQ